MPFKIAEEHPQPLERLNEHGEPVFLECSFLLNGNLRVRVDEAFVKLATPQIVAEILDAIRYSFLPKEETTQ